MIPNMTVRSLALAQTFIIDINILYLYNHSEILSEGKNGIEVGVKIRTSWFSGICSEL